MKAEIICIGTELLTGDILNTNVRFVSEKMAQRGIDVHYHTDVGDNPERIGSVFKSAVKRSDIVIATGGLGATVDDVTVRSLSKIFNIPLVLHKKTLKNIKRFSREKNIDVSLDIKQAYVLKGSRVIENSIGTAPGIYIKIKACDVFLFPGVSREMQTMVEGYLMPYLKKHSKQSLFTRTIKTMGIRESEVNEKVKDILTLGPDITVGIYAHLSQVELRIRTKAKDIEQANKKFESVEKEIEKRLKNNIFGKDRETLEEVVGALLLKNSSTLSVAESCTGGLLSNRITNVSGSSKYFLVGITSYSNESKIKILGVQERLIKRYGAVSRQIAEQMAEGVKRISNSTYAIGITGIAGPEGGTKQKPVGLVFISIADKKDIHTHRFIFSSGREDIKHTTVQYALNLIRLNIWKNSLM